MKIKEAIFLQSNTDYRKCPAPNLPEYAFIGRSNVGKSSLINAMTKQKGLAKTSQTPGKTQLINHYLINKTWYLVDLPGYGYAKISKTERAKIETIIMGYLMNRPNLMCVFVLIDVRHLPQANDLGFVDNLGKKGVPIKIVFTKADKINATQAQTNMTHFRNALLQAWESVPDFFLTSAEKNTGSEAVLTAIDEMNPLFRP